MLASTLTPRQFRRWKWNTPSEFLTRTTLDHDGIRIESWGLSGGRSERIPLDAIESVSLVRRSKQDQAALALRLRSGKRMVLKVKGAALWKYDLEQLCGLANTDQAAVPRVDRASTKLISSQDELEQDTDTAATPPVPDWEKLDLTDDDYPFTTDKL